MSEHMPIPFPEAATGLLRLHEDVSFCVEEAIRAELINGTHRDRTVLFHIVLREARIPALVQGQIRRVHHHSDAVELDVTNMDETYTEWTTFTLGPDDVVWFLG